MIVSKFHLQKIVKVDLEGGFYGIEVSSVSGGEKYLPVNIQTELSDNENKEIQVTAALHELIWSEFICGVLMLI